MNEELAAHYAAKIQATLGYPGRLISMSKSWYREQHPDDFTVFNANVCLNAGKIWHGDINLTLDESKLVELSRLTRSIVYVLYESDSRFKNEEEPVLGAAVYSVTPSGHTKFDFRYVERDREGLLRRRPPVPIRRPRFRWSVLRHRPRLWRFWRLERVRNQDRSLAGVRRQENRLLYIGARDRGKTPLLVLGFFHCDREAVWGEWTWHPAHLERRHAPRALLDGRPSLKLHLYPFHLTLHVWIHASIWPGLEYSFYAGYRIRRWW